MKRAQKVNRPSQSADAYEDAATADELPAVGAVRDRIVGFGRLRASVFVPHPENPRVHSDLQRSALRELFDSIGLVGVELVRKLPDGRLQLLDGHMRAEEIGALGDQELWYAETDLSEDEARVVLASFDPIARLATFHQDRSAALLNMLSARHSQVKDLLSAVAAQDNMAWLLSRATALPTGAPARYGSLTGDDADEADANDDTPAPKQRAHGDLLPPQLGAVEARYGVLAECADEREQRRAYDLLTQAGFACRVLTM